VNGYTQSSNLLFLELLNMNRTTQATMSSVKVVGEMLFLYGLLGWTYGVLVQLVHPYWLPLPLSHLIPWIRIDTFTILSFVLSAIGFVTWKITGELTKPPTK
jgi:hypothetical protein